MLQASREQAEVGTHDVFVCTGVVEGGIGDGVVEEGLQQVLPQSCWRLVRHLHRVLQYRHWKLWCLEGLE